MNDDIREYTKYNETKPLTSLNKVRNKYIRSFDRYQWGYRSRHEDLLNHQFERRQSCRRSLGMMIALPIVFSRLQNLSDSLKEGKEEHPDSTSESK